MFRIPRIPDCVGALLPPTRFPSQLPIDRDFSLLVFPFSVLHVRATRISPFRAVGTPHSRLRDFESPYSGLALKSAGLLTVTKDIL